MNDYGIMNLALESEMAYFNLEKELMKEEVKEKFLNEANDKNRGEEIKQTLTKVLNKIKELVAKFFALFKNVINKVYTSTNLAKKYIQKNKDKIDNFKGSFTVDTIKYVKDPSHLKDASQSIDTLSKTAIAIIESKHPEIPTSTEQFGNLMNKKIKDYKMDEALSVDYNKIKMKVSNEDISTSKDFVTKLYPSLAKERVKTTDYMKTVAENANKAFKIHLANTGTENDISQRLISGVHLNFCMQIVSLLSKYYGKYMNVVNATFTGSMKILRQAVAEAEK